MGWAWALHFTQWAHEHRISEIGVPDEYKIEDKRPSECMTDSPDSFDYAAYVDNNILLGLDPKTVAAVSTDIQNSLTEHGLPVHELVGPTQDIDFVGLHFDGRTHEVRVSWSRLWKTRLAVMYILKNLLIDGKPLERIIGHITWSILLKREYLNILSSCYAFIRKRYKH